MNLPLFAEKCRRVRPQTSRRAQPARRGTVARAVTGTAKESEQPIALGRRPARVGPIDERCVAAEMLENPLDRSGLLDTRDHPQLPATAPADLDVYGEYPPEALRPGERALPIGGQWLALLLRIIGCGARFGHDPGPIRARRREYAMVADQVGTRLRHQGRESRDKVLGLKDDVRRAVPIAHRRARAADPNR